MSKKYITSVLIPALLIQLCGCYSMQNISKDEMAGLKVSGDLTVQTRDSTIYFFEESNYHISNDSIYGNGYAKFTNTSEFKMVNKCVVAMTNIETIQQDELNLFNTTLLVIGIILVAVGVGALIATLPVGGIR
ncbi:MAG TPA: hypothetical protein VH917_05455 [Ignavibacteriaceae bacterium]